MTPQALLDAAISALRTRLPAGVDVADVDDFVARHRPTLLKIVEHAFPASLYQRYADQGAPQPGTRGYRSPAPASPGVQMLHTARALLDEPAFFWMWSAAVGIADEDDAGRADFADTLGVPHETPDGRRLSDDDRLSMGIWIVDLAMLTDPQRAAGVGWTGGERYLNLAEDGQPLPLWLAEALAEDAFQPDTALRLVNVSLEDACAFIARHHRHLPTCNRRGIMFAIGVRYGQRLVAVATAGAPTGRWGGQRVDPRDVLELTRVASDGTVKGAASKLVARLIDLLPRTGRAGGPTLFVTYQLATEAGTPYRALREKGLRPVARVPGRAAGGARMGSTEALAEHNKLRWEAGPAALPARWELLHGEAT